MSLRVAARVFAFIFAFVLSLVNVCADEVADKWANDVTGTLGEIGACFQGGELPTGINCNVFVGHTLERLYGVTDFRSSQGRYFSANETAEFLVTAGAWRAIGPASEQANLDDAANAARGVPVVAVWRNPLATSANDSSHHGHIALIGPGPLMPSTAWHLNVPTSAAASIDSPNGRYIGDRLSRAFGAGKKDAVMLYARAQQ